MFRLNVHLPDSIGERMNKLVSLTGQTKVSITAAALDQYLTQQEAQRKLLESISDAENFGKLCAAAGIDFNSLMQK